MSSMYFTHAKMRSHLRKVKRINSEARILGLDLGRKFVGIAVSDRQIKECRPYKTLTVDPQLFQPQYDMSKNSTFFNALKILIRSKHIKGLVVGYPMTNKNE